MDIINAYCFIISACVIIIIILFYTMMFILLAIHTIKVMIIVKLHHMQSSGVNMADSMVFLLLHLC